ncbi:MAG: hypothetical protein L0Y56_13175, partial [Nitrospira sp.]|nr:hypothetical protein [Nitrospira sp.]
TTDAGMLAKGLTNVKIAAFNAAEGFRAMSIASKILLTSGIGAILLVIGGLITHFATMRKSGKDVEDSLYDLIGRSQDATAALQSQGSSLRKVSKAWMDYNSAVKVASDPTKLKESLMGGDYKSPLKALKTYRDTLASTGLAMAKLDPRSVEGISETGDYLIDVSGGYAMVAASAADAQKATTAAFQTQVIKAYADEIVKAQGFWDTLIERITFGAADMSLAKDAADLREQISGVAKEMGRLSEAGIASDFLQGRMNDLVGQELEVREKMVGSAMNLKRVLDEMPTFESAELAKMALGPELRKSIEAVLPTGVFGRDATAGSVVMGKFARTAGLGGLIGSESTAGPDRLLQEFIEKGLRTSMTGKLSATKGGGITVLAEEAAKALLEMSVGTEKIASMGPKATQAIEGARTMVTTVDEVTGEVVYHFEDGITGMIRTLEESKVNEILTKTATEAVTLNRAEIEAAGERTKKLLTLQYTGALAGIRVPAGGMPQIGPGTMRE